ncbi:hypothetical protein [Pasteurella multocida]|uniref:hypothetical protein n=1 Tax=Pasteurella multocida TaxID=747 RepID=UPI002FE390F2
MLILEYLEKFRAIIKDIEKELKIHFKEEILDKYEKKITYKGIISGVKVRIFFGIDKKSEISLFIGERKDYNRAIYRSIGVSFGRTKQAIKREMWERLGVKDTIQCIENILEYRKTLVKVKEEEKCIDAIFKHYLPFNDCYNNGLYARYKGVHFDVNQTRRKINIDANDIDFILKIIAYAKSLLDEEAKQKE